MNGQQPRPISPQDVYKSLGTALAPVVIDVRRAQAFDGDNKLIVGAIRREPDAVDGWRHGLPADRLVVVYCVHGREVSQNAAARLRQAGIEAHYLEGGIGKWVELGLPVRRRLEALPVKWVTRERPKIDRIACPWLIRRFVDPAAEFVYVPTERVFAVAKETGATAYDIPGAEPFSHDGEKCSFDAFLKVFGLSDPALDQLAVIVRGADTARLDLAPQCPGLAAISLGLSANFADDHAMLELGMHVYDALFAWCRSLQGEVHNWKPTT